ncbi:MAG: hypothetical protein IKK37_06470 [Clostridia bacterium]|nr:hypothetical protein [Clostridia bacterium]
MEFYCPKCGYANSNRSDVMCSLCGYVWDERGYEALTGNNMKYTRNKPKNKKRNKKKFDEATRKK